MSELGQEAVDAARERQRRRMERRKTQGLLLGMLSLPVMLAIGFFIGWGIFPPERADMMELAGDALIIRHCIPSLEVYVPKDGVPIEDVVEEMDEMVAGLSGTAEWAHVLVGEKHFAVVYQEVCE